MDNLPNNTTTQLDCTDKYIAVVSGANRGIGLEFIKQLSRQQNTILIALVRPSCSLNELIQLNNQYHNIHTVYIELDNSDTIISACQHIHKLVTHINLLINCAGYAGLRNYEDQPLSIDLNDLMLVFQINTVAQLQLIQLLHDLLVNTNNNNSQRCVVILNLSSRTASPQHAIHYGGCASYRISKISLNMLSAELCHEDKQCIYIPISPGHVITDMGRLSGRTPTLSAHDSVQGMLGVVNTVKLDDSGKFYNYDGSIIQY